MGLRRGSTRRPEKTGRREFHGLYSSSGDQIKGNEAGEACGTCGGEVKCISYSILAGYVKGKNHLKDLNIDERIILIGGHFQHLL